MAEQHVYFEYNTQVNNEEINVLNKGISVSNTKAQVKNFEYF